MSQKSEILQYMRDYGGITQKDATDYIGCTRLAARISDLRRDGHRIEARPKKVPNRHGEMVLVAEYRLEKNG